MVRCLSCGSEGVELASDEAVLTPEVFDQAFRTTPIWGAKAIGQEAGVSAETVRRSWPRDPVCPVRRIGGRLVVYREDLRAWLGARG